MALIRFPLNAKNIGYVRNNKASTTTILNYIGQILWDEKSTNISGTGTIMGNLGDDAYYGREKGFDFYKQELLQCDIKIAVYRDPINKLLSGFYHSKLQRPHLNLDTFLDNYQLTMEKDNYIRIHCRTNTDMLGKSKDIYDYVFNTNEVDTKLKPLLEDWSNKKILPVKHRKQTYPKPTKQQIEKIKIIFQNDYENRWC